jgi:hypothetical protein
MGSLAPQGLTTRFLGMSLGMVVARSGTPQHSSLRGIGKPYRSPLRNDIDRTMRLLGCDAVAKLDASYVFAMR